MSETERIPVAVIGVGRMGKHHARIYKSLPQAQLVAVVDADADRGAMVAAEFGCESVASAQELLKRFPQVKAVTVAVPTVRHLAVAEPLLKSGVACLIEKPLAPSSAEARELVDLAAANKVALQVGHTERFNPAVRAVSALAITPRFMEVHRISPMTFRSLDVGVVMDMMIHDLDIVLSLANSKLAKVEAVGVAVLSTHEDVANARLVFENGCVANVTASRLALKTERKLRLFSESAYVSLDYQKRTGIVIRKSDNDESLTRIREQIRDGADLSSVDYSDLVSVDELEMDGAGHADPLTAELASFLEAVRSGDAPVVDGAAGVAAVEAAEMVVQALRSHKWEGLSSWNA